MKFKDDLPNICLYCEHSASLETDELVICDKKGVVKPDYHCRKFFPDLIKYPVEIRSVPHLDTDAEEIKKLTEDGFPEPMKK